MRLVVQRQGLRYMSQYVNSPALGGGDRSVGMERRIFILACSLLSSKIVYCKQQVAMSGNMEVYRKTRGISDPFHSSIVKVQR